MKKNKNPDSGSKQQISDKVKIYPPFAVNWKSPGRHSESIVNVRSIDSAVHRLQSHTGTAAESAQNQSRAPTPHTPPLFPLLFFRNYALTLSPTLKFHDLGTARPLQNKSAAVVNRRMNQLISSAKKLLKRKPSETLGHTQRVSSLVHTYVSLFCA